MPTRYHGPSAVTELMRFDLVRPASLASADFDEDGVPALVCGYASPDSGLIVLHRGNIASIFPNERHHTVEPSRSGYTLPGRSSPPPADVAPAFVPDAQVVSVPMVPDYLETGDFDADGHQDIFSRRNQIMPCT